MLAWHWDWTNFKDYDLTDMMTMIDTNIKGLLTVTRQLLPQMVENNEGHIINIGSTAVFTPMQVAAVYAWQPNQLSRCFQMVFVLILLIKISR